MTSGPNPLAIKLIRANQVKKNTLERTAKHIHTYNWQLTWQHENMYLVINKSNVNIKNRFCRFLVGSNAMLIWLCFAIVVKIQWRFWCSSIFKTAYVARYCITILCLINVISKQQSQSTNFDTMHIPSTNQQSYNQVECNDRLSEMNGTTDPFPFPAWDHSLKVLPFSRTFLWKANSRP